MEQSQDAKNTRVSQGCFLYTNIEQSAAVSLSSKCASSCVLVVDKAYNARLGKGSYRSGPGGCEASQKGNSPMDRMVHMRPLEISEAIQVLSRCVFASFSHYQS